MRIRRAAVIGALAGTAIIAGCVSSSVPAIAEIPASLRVPENQTLIREVRATGVQIYECKASAGEPVVFQWSFKAPEAELRDKAGKVFGRHYAGPTWEAYDGSKVVGEVTARDSGPDPNAIPWLLLSATSAAGQGVLSQTTSIQRLMTSGGKAPAAGCSEALVGQEARVPYTAEYLFYASRR